TELLVLYALVDVDLPVEPGQRAEHEVRRQPLAQKQPLALAVLGQIADARLETVGDRSDMDRFAVYADGCRFCRPQPENALEDLRPSRADHAAETQHLAGPGNKGHVMDKAGDREVLDLEDRLGVARAALVWIEHRKLASDHPSGHVLLL